MTRKRFRHVLTALTVVNRALARGKLGLEIGFGENTFISAIIRAIPVLLAREGKREASNRAEWKRNLVSRFVLKLDLFDYGWRRIDFWNGSTKNDSTTEFIG